LLVRENNTKRFLKLETVPSKKPDNAFRDRFTERNLKFLLRKEIELIHGRKWSMSL
jgi:hypothetical protein